MAKAGAQYVGRLLTRARRKAHNISHSVNQGIDDPEALDLANDGLENIITKIAQKNSEVFTQHKYMDATANVAEYSFPNRLMHGGRIVSIHYSPLGVWGANTYHYNVRGPISENERTFYTGYPDSYGFTDGIIWFSPMPQTTLANAFRIIYREEPHTLDIRRGTINSATVLNTTARTITTLKIDTGATADVVDSTGALRDDYLCIVDAYGAPYMQSIPITAFNSSTGEITVANGFVYQVGETAPTGAYVCMGHNASTHNQYDKAIDSYLVDYMALNIDAKDLDDAAYSLREKKLMNKEAQIVQMFADGGMTEDFIYIPGQFG